MSQTVRVWPMVTVHYYVHNAQSEVRITTRQETHPTLGQLLGKFDYTGVGQFGPFRSVLQGLECLIEALLIYSCLCALQAGPAIYWTCLHFYRCMSGR